MAAVLTILRYMKGTSSKGILYTRNENLDLVGYTNANWAGDRDDRKSTSGYFTLVGGNLATWKTKKQKVVALSSAEVEYRGIVKRVTKILWIRKLLSELNCHQTQASLRYYDNRSQQSASPRIQFSMIKRNT